MFYIYHYIIKIVNRRKILHDFKHCAEGKSKNFCGEGGDIFLLVFKSIKKGRRFKKINKTKEL